MMKKIDKTKENIGVSKLDESTRKKLFDDFVDAGGEVIKEKQRDGFANFDRDKQKQYKSRIDEHHKKIKNAKIPKQSTYQKSKTARQLRTQSLFDRSGKPGSFRLFFQRLSIRFHLFFMGVTDIYAYNLTLKFLDNFDLDYSTSLLGIQTLYLDVIKQNPRIGKTIIEQLDSMQPVYFELMELVSNVFDRTIINEILNHHYNFPAMMQTSTDIQEPITAIFRKLHPIAGFYEDIQYAFDKAIDIQMRSEKNKSSIYSAKKKKAKNHLYIIFSKLYPRLYWLICNYEGKRFDSNQEIEERLSIDEMNKPGRRKKADAPRMIELPVIDNPVIEKEKENEEETIPDDVKKGLELMYKLDLNKIKESYDTKNLLKHMKDTDKVWITFLLFIEFDREYSFILTTNKIKFNPATVSSQKIDFKSRLSDHYNELNKCSEILNDYANMLGIYEKTRMEKPISNTQYMEYTNRLTSLEKERKEAGTTARMKVKNFMSKLAADLKILIDDMNNAQTVIDNPQDDLKFDPQIEGNKKLNGKKIHEAVLTAYQYASALEYRLGLDGDLCGSMEFKEGEENTLEQKSGQKESAGNTATTGLPELKLEKAEEDKSKEKKSIIEELDDLL